MMTPEEQYEQYMRMHRDFSQSYAMVYKQVMDFYPLPQKFISEATPEIDNQLEKLWTCRNNPTAEETFHDFIYFAKNFQEFAGTANSIFEEYTELRNKSGDYIKTVFRLKEKNLPDNIGRDEYVELIPVLNKLIGGFNQVKQKTNEIAKNLLKLQSDWLSLKQKMIPPKGSTPPL
jgi:hypothetical protein